jgi:hypothetical protein
VVRSLVIPQGQVELAVLMVVVELHPDHLTPSELVLKISGKRDEGAELADAIRELRGSGLLRFVGDVVAPTHAALQAVTLLTL